MLKLESNDLLLVRVCHSIELTPLSLAYLESGVYCHIDGSILLIFICSGFALMLFCRCVLSLPPSVSHFLGRYL
jgi:hypothetical protein